MTYREVGRLVMPYINGSIIDEGLEELLDHTEHCENCREELEIYFTVDMGIRQLDERTGSYNIQGALEIALELSCRRIHTLKLLQTARYTIDTLCFWALLMALILQFRLWGQNGFLDLQNRISLNPGLQNRVLRDLSLWKQGH